MSTYMVIGLGSMGKRRIRLLQKNFIDIDIVGVDPKLDRLKEVHCDFGIKTFESINKALENRTIQGAFVCTSPITHSTIISECLTKNLHIFTEINLINENYSELIASASDKDVTLFLSSTMLYRKEVQYIQERVKASKKKICYRYHLGKYLPDWHPWENYKEFFVADKRTNGCREIFGIELPWIIKTFGKVKRIQVLKDKVTDLDIDYNDIYFVNIKHEHGHQGVFIADIVSRSAIRNLEIISEDFQLRWDGTPSIIQELDLSEKKFKTVAMNQFYYDEKYNQKNIVDTTYLEELEYFFAIVNGGNNFCYGFEEDSYTISLIDQIEKI